MSSKLPSVLSATDEDIQLLLAAQAHIGTKNCDKQMQPYVWKRRADGTLIIHEDRRFFSRKRIDHGNFLVRYPYH